MHDFVENDANSPEHFQEVSSGLGSQDQVTAAKYEGGEQTLVLFTVEIMQGNYHE